MPTASVDCSTMDSKERFLRASEAAGILSVGRTTIHRWSEDGTLPVATVTKGGQRRFRLSDVSDLAQRRGFRKLAPSLRAMAELAADVVQKSRSHSDALPGPPGSRRWFLAAADQLEAMADSKNPLSPDTVRATLEPIAQVYDRLMDRVITHYVTLITETEREPE